jgi:hypothetical protein
MDVPVASPRFIRRTTLSPDFFANLAFGPGPSNSPGTPCANDIWWTLPSCLTVMSKRWDSALTAEAPTPWRPPEVL